MQVVAKAFEAGRPGVKVQWQIGAPGALLDTIARGEPVDVWLGTDADISASGLLRKLLLPNPRAVFASNRLVLIAPVSSEPPVQRLSDLAQPQVQRVAMGQVAVEPAGRYARQAIDGQRLWPLVQQKVVFASDVREVLRLVATGEVDAGFVYATDATAAAQQVRVVQPLQISAPINHRAHVAVASPQAALADAFVVHLRGPAAQALLKSAGFGQP
jgi:molybdate transport system substrate-binding protein